MNSLKSTIILLLLASMPFALSAKENAQAKESTSANNSASAKEIEIMEV